MSTLVALQSRWSNLNPKHRRALMVGGGVLGMFLLISVFASDGERRPRDARPEKPISTGLTDQNLRDVSLDALVAQLNLASTQQQELMRKVDALSNELEQKSRPGAAEARLNAEMVALRNQLDELRSTGGLASLGGFFSAAEPAPEPASAGEAKRSRTVPERSRADAAVGEAFRRDPVTPVSAAPAAAVTINTLGRPEAGTAARAPLKILTHTASADRDEEEAAAEETVYLPSGSILTGTLLNGMDVPTSQGARRDPFPAAVRIQHEAILPNHFHADVRECFALISGFGDMSSERAYLRGESISCVREDGGIVEARFDSYAVGEDGKAGIRGRLVSKQGTIIARSMLAGFAAGAAEAFDVSPIPVLQTGNIDNQQAYMQNYSSDVLQGALSKGAAGALERVAQFYLDMAEGMFPVIEVDAGRQVELIMTKGAELRLYERTSRGRG